MPGPWTSWTSLGKKRKVEGESEEEARRRCTLRLTKTSDQERQPQQLPTSCRVSITQHAKQACTMGLVMVKLEIIILLQLLDSLNRFL